MIRFFRAAGRRASCAVLLIVLALGLGAGRQETDARSSGVSLESIMVSNLVRLSAAHTGQWNRTIFRRGVQIRVQHFSQCGCDTALFGLHGRYATLQGQLYVDKSSGVSSGRVEILSAADFVKPQTYRTLWHQDQMTRDHPVPIHLRVAGATYLLIRISDRSCCLAVDVIANVSRG